LFAALEIVVNPVPLVPELPVAPLFPEVPEVPELPCAPLFPEVPDEPALPLPELPDEPALPDVPVDPELPVAPVAPELPMTLLTLCFHCCHFLRLRPNFHLFQQNPTNRHYQ